jgi:hypothetical protein
VGLLVLQWLLWFVVPFIMPSAVIVGVIGGVLCGLAVVIWWLLFSRAPWAERFGTIALMVLAVFVTYRLVHISIQNGMMGMMLPIFVVPFLSLALVAGAVASRRLTSGRRRALIAVAIVLACAGFTVVRTGGITGDANSDFHWRWTKSPEERLLAQTGDEPAVLSVPAAREGLMQAGLDWPGFRGANRDGVVHSVRIKTDWVAAPPVELWRRPIGPAWSSFAVHGNLLYTQEQRGEDEIVSCYNLTNGQPVWKHRDATRFWESNAGAGPRATPTLNRDRLYTFGGTGILNALDAATGAVVWSRNVAADTHKKLPGWGFASSPLVLDDLVIVAAAGELAAYDRATGASRWFGPDGGSGYSSPQLFTINGVPQIVLLSGTGATAVAPADGKRLWEYPLPSGARIVQPGLTASGDVLTHDGEGNGMRRIALKQESGGWSVAERWNSAGLNPYFNDFVVHKDYAFGFDGSSLACIDLKDGERKWKGGSYGHGQLVLLPDQDLLLVLSEEGELALVQATPNQLTELARFPAIEGKTWNHPVLVGDVLVVRNGQEMAAFRLALAGG